MKLVETCKKASLSTLERDPREVFEKSMAPVNVDREAFDEFFSMSFFDEFCVNLKTHRVVRLG